MPITHNTSNPASTGLHLISRNAGQRRSPDRGIVHAKSQDGLLTWTYTTRLYATFHHPEVLVAGLDPFLAHSVVSQVVDLVSSGNVYSRRSVSDDLLHHLTCVFRMMSSVAAGRLIPELGTQTALQIVYPDPRNFLPWHVGHNASWRAMQPLFLADHPMGEVEARFLDAALLNTRSTRGLRHQFAPSHLQETR